MQGADEFPYGDKYEWGSKTFLGQGAFGKVYKVRNKEDK